jgi:RNA polymerase sigma-70 factor, ECF subfamily
MSSSPARYFPGIFPKREESEISIEREKPGFARGTNETEDCADEGLLLRLQREDREALGILYRRYARIIYSICLRILKDQTEAQDVVHEVFLSLYRRCKSFDPEKGAARSWIIQLAYSKCFDWRSYLISRHPYRHEDSVTEENKHSSTVVSLKSDPDPAYFVLWNARMVLAFKNLSREQQKALHLFYFQGYTFQEIADTLGCSYGNAKHHVYRGIERLRSNLFDGGMPDRIAKSSVGLNCSAKEVAG